MKNIIKSIGKPFVKIIRDINRSIDDEKVPVNFSHNVKITDKNICELKIDFPPRARSLRIDVGLSHNAPNSAKWLLDRSDLFVIGIEANKYNAYKLITAGMWSKNNPELIIRPYKSDNFCILYCAIDNVEMPCNSQFYHMKGDAGTSSLLEPTDRLLKDHGYSVKDVSDVPTIPLSTILEIIPWKVFDYIEVLKVDTQGKDLDVLKSAKQYLDKIALISVEVDTFGQYHGAAKKEDIYEFMKNSNFYPAKVLSNVENEVVDILFANRKFEAIIPTLLETL